MPDNTENISNQNVIERKEEDRIKITSEKIMGDFKRARTKRAVWLKEAEDDFDFALGKQWDDTDIADLNKVGVKALTINKIQPMLYMLSGTQRQNRSDFIAYPEGEEDSIKAEISTRLLKNLIKNSDGEFKLSEQFEDGIICGEGWLEPFIDYTYDIINGEMKIKKLDPSNLYPDPDSREYDLSDAQYVIKYLPNMSKDQLKILFPNKREKIEGLSNGKISLDNLDKETQPHIQVLDYPEQTQDNLKEDERTLEPVFDVVEYYYKKPVTKHLVVSLATGDIIETDDEQTANQKAELLNKEAAIQGKPPETRVITRVIPEIWVAKMVGNSEIMVNEISWTYPKYKGYPFIPFKAHWVNTKMTKKQELTVQGLTRSLKDPQIEHNKRRTQELRHLNQSANSGWMLEENSIKNPESIKEFGASPGVNIVVKEGKPFPQKIVPTPLSQGHAQLAAENAQDMKEISGINTDLLASQEGGTDSGRAIFLRQQQGLVMVQRVMDNFKHSKRILGRFLLTMLGKVYSLEETMKILGENFIQKNFSVEPPPEQDPATGTPIPQDPVVDMSAVKQTIITILEESENLKKYDVEIGEAKSSITMRLTNLAIMQDMVAAGLPIPPDVLIDQSLLDNATKEKVKQSIQQAQQAQAQQGAQ